MIMQMNGVADNLTGNKGGVQSRALSGSPLAVQAALLTGCQDRHYAFGLAMALVSKGVHLHVIGSKEEDSPEFYSTPRLRFLNFRSGRAENVGFARKLSRLLVYYAKLVRYVASSKTEVLHILWNNKFEYFDRTILMLYYKLCGKKIVLTAHNVNQARRDLKDTWLNRTTLKVQYKFCDSIFVHTEKMKDELRDDFDVDEKAITVIRYPLNNALPDTELTSAEAKGRLGVRQEERTILFLGRIRPYKGIEFLLDAFRLLVADEQANYRMIIAREPKKGSEEYLDMVRQSIRKYFDQDQVIFRAQFIPDEEMEVYLKGADVLVLPYKEIFQSGILFLAYSFGLPVVATDVGSFREDIVEGCTGFLCKSGDPNELAKAMETYFASDLYRGLSSKRQEIKDYANVTHSWDAVAGLTCAAYAKILGRKLP